MIPRILHRIWLGGGAMPPEFEDYGRRWRALNPGWTTIEWRDPDSLPPLRNQTLFDRAQQITPHDWRRFQADLLRLELLWHHGGVYVDTDVEPLRPLPDELRTHEAFAAWSPNRAAVPAGGGHVVDGALTNAVLGALPANRFITRCIEALPEAVRQHGSRTLAQMVGPWHLTRVWANDPDGIKLLPAHVFYPQSTADRDRGARPEISHDTLAWHHWATSRDRRT